MNAANGGTGYTKEIDYQARLSNSIVMFSQGVPFLHAGVDFLRTKGGNENSYDASDTVNQLNWIRKSSYVDSFEYYKGIIKIRKTYESFKMVSESEIEENLTFIYPTGNGMIGYNLTKNNEDILIYHNGGESINDITLPSGAWMLIADRDFAGLDSLGTFTATYPIEKAETLVFVRGEYADVIESPIHEVVVTIPKITNLFSSIFEGGTFTLTSNTEIYEYTVNGNTFNNVNPPTNSITIEGFPAGIYSIQVKNSEGILSEIFTLIIKEKIVVEVSCDEDPSQEKCEVVPVICTDDQTLIDDTCVDITVCTDDQSLINNECIDNEVPNGEPDLNDSTGCFGSVGSRSLFVFGVMIMIGGPTLLFIRRH